MSERPILFSGPMVRAILEGRKSQTRRVLKPQPFDDGYYEGEVFCDFVPAPASNQAAYARFSAAAVGGGAFRTETYEPRYAVGDRLWVREAHHRTDDGGDDHLVGYDFADDPSHVAERREIEGGGTIQTFRHSLGGWGGRTSRNFPSIHMPRWASRITLEVTGVKVERLQDISEEDAIAEGCPGCLGPNPDFPDEWDPSQQEEFRSLWERINGPGSWEANPWVVAISFNRIKP